MYVSTHRVISVYYYSCVKVFHDLVGVYFYSSALNMSAGRFGEKPGSESHYNSHIILACLPGNT